MKNLHPLTTAALATVLTATVTLSACGEPKAQPQPEPVKAGVHFNEGTWVEPYGGCDEAWAYPGTPGYRQCVRHLSDDVIDAAVAVTFPW